MPDEKREDLEQKKEAAILAICDLAEKDYDKLLDALILVATAAKRKTSTSLIGIKAILNEKEPEPDPQAKKENITKPGPGK